jgi:hypothetical protein
MNLVSGRICSGVFSRKLSIVIELTVSLFITIFLPTSIRAGIIESMTEGPSGIERGGCAQVAQESAIVRKGSVAIKHHVGASCGERSEVTGRRTQIGGTYWTGWSFHLPSDWKKSNKGNIIAQWASAPTANGRGGKYPCGGNGHKLTFQPDGLQFNLQHPQGGKDMVCNRYQIASPEEMKGKWTDFVMHAKYTGNSDGFLKLWLKIGNGPYTLKVDYKGPTWWNDEGTGPFFKMGYYLGNPGSNVSVTAYTDEYRLGDSSAKFEDVSPSDAVDTPKPQTSITLSLEQGWNLISLPLQPVDSSINTVLKSLSDSFLAIYSFDNSSMNYKSYIPGAASNDLLTLKTGEGYWIYMDSPSRLELSGTAVPSTMNLSSGWNLSGFSSMKSMEVAQAFASISGVLEAAYGYDTSKGSYLEYIPGSTADLKVLEPGNGYWIYVASNTSWVIK